MVNEGGKEAGRRAQNRWKRAHDRAGAGVARGTEGGGREGGPDGYPTLGKGCEIVSDAKRAIERAHLDEAIAVAPKLFPSGAYEQGEAPDFVFTSNSRRVGVEVMDYHQGPRTDRGSELRRVEERNASAVRKASQVFEVSWPETPFLNVDVAIRNGAEPGTMFSEDLAALVVQNIPTRNSTRIVQAFGSSELRASLLTVLIARLDSFTRHFWVCPEFGSFGWSHDEIQAQIDEKRLKADSYLQRCDEVWLLLVAGASLHMSGMASEPTDDSSFMAEPLSKVLFYDRWGNTVKELPLVEG